MIEQAQFERLLDAAAKQLGDDVRASTQYHQPNDFERRVFEVLRTVAAGEQISIDPTFHPHAFPDIKANGYGVEVKTTNKDSWLSVGNSIFEGMRDPTVRQIYVMFGKMGGLPSVKWGRYEDRITHVRISHAPRFVLEMDRDSSLFGKMKVSYDDFSKQPPEDKMRHVRQYSRGRLKPGERLWWLEDENSPGKPLEVRLYMSLQKPEKTKLRAQGAILFPQIVAGGRVKEKYNDVAFFFLKYHNVFCPQTRDLYSAGSVAGKARGGNYLQRALKNIEAEMREAAENLPGDLIEEYWGERVEPQNRIKEWLRRADWQAKESGWKPSEHLFTEG
ncbi:MAG: hypothetical protein WA252_12720 [Candidatus Sulfotelmatobacter sp.]